MSPPKTNIERQKRRHIGPLIGISVALVFVIGLILIWLFVGASETTPPEGAETQIDGRTGEQVEEEPTITPQPAIPPPPPAD